MTKMLGVIAPIITPMNEDESINFTELRNQVNRLIANGIHGIFPFGTNGEGYILGEEEKMAALAVIVEEVAGRVPVYAGVGAISTQDTIRQALKAQALGVDYLSVITPSFAVASQDELFTHYETVAHAVDLPIILYNIPARTGNALAPATVARLAEIKNIVGAKDSSGNFDNMLQYIEKTRQRADFSVLSGNDSLILWNLLAGGAGGVAGCANVYPDNMVQIYEEFLKGNLEKSREYQDAIRSFRDCFRFGNPNTIVKTAVKLLGYPVGKCRAPFNQVSALGLEKLQAVLASNKARGMH